MDLNWAIEKLQQGELDEAIVYLKSSLEDGHDEEKFQIAGIFHELGMLEESKNILADLVILYPHETGIRLMLGEVYLDNSEDENALETLSYIPADDANYPASLMLQADLYQLEGYPEVAERKLLEAYDLVNDKTIVDFALAELYFANQDLQKAATYYRDLVSKDVHEFGGVSIQARLASTLTLIGEYSEALPVWDQLDEGSFDASDRIAYAYCLEKEGRSAQAERIYQELMEEQPEWYPSYQGFISLLEHQDRFGEAFDVAKKLIEVDPSYADAYVVAARFAMNMGNSHEAKPLLENALEIDPDFLEANLLYNQILLHAEEYEGLVNRLEQMLEAGEYDPQFHWDLAFAKSQLEYYEEALKHYREAYNYFKDHVPFIEEYAQYLLSEGRREEAKNVVSKGIELDRNNENLLHLLEDLSEY